MNDLQIFKNCEFGEIRTSVVNNEPYFSLNEYQNTARFLKIVNR